MKKTLLLFLAGAFVLAGCDKNNEENGVETTDPNAPKIEVGVTGNLIVLPEGGEQSFTYGIVNPVEGGKMLASADEWLGEITVTEDAVVFSAEPNESGADRSTIITLTYEYGDAQTVTAQVNAIQSAWDRPLTFDFELTPTVNSVIMNITPSDLAADYFVTVIDNSFYEAGYTDEQIMDQILTTYGQYLSQYALSGVTTDYEVKGMQPATEYIAIAFGVDVNSATATSEMSKETFTTLESQPTDAYVTASMNNYWDIEDLAAYNSSYGDFLQDPSVPVLAAVDFVYNETAVSCVYVLWTGDLTGENQDELYSATMTNGDMASEGDPAPLFYVAFEDAVTLCVIGVDEDGNYGEMYSSLIAFPESGKSTDYARFDEYYNALMGYAPAKVRANYVEKDVQTLLSARDFAGKASSVFCR